uniref:Preproalvinellacin n=1 Tax=Alvinella pompejana TaxID=6376 RepID=A0A023VYT8_9ANNE|nr:preproalvinellacin [Alvinella pompejana]
MTYSVVVTLVLVFLVVFGSLHMERQLQKCNAQHTSIEPLMREEEERFPTKVYHIVDDDETEQDIEVDQARDREIIHLKERDSDEYSLPVFDFKQNLGAIYDDLTGSCYVMGGLDSSLPDSVHIQRLLENKTDGNDIVKELDYTVNSERPLRDLSLIPAELQTLCWGKPVFWISKTLTEDKGSHRQKRGCYTRCWKVGRNGRVCMRVCT